MRPFLLKSSVLGSYGEMVKGVIIVVVLSLLIIAVMFLIPPLITATALATAISLPYLSPLLASSVGKLAHFLVLMSVSAKLTLVLVSIIFIGAFSKQIKEYLHAYINTKKLSKVKNSSGIDIALSFSVMTLLLIGALSHPHSSFYEAFPPNLVDLTSQYHPLITELLLILISCLLVRSRVLEFIIKGAESLAALFNAENLLKFGRTARAFYRLYTKGEIPLPKRAQFYSICRYWLLLKGASIKEYIIYCCTLFLYYPTSQSQVKFKKFFAEEKQKYFTHISEAESGITKADKRERFLKKVRTQINGEEVSLLIEDSTSHAIDYLSRDEFVNKLYEHICQHSNRKEIESFAVGLHGAWGEGKTHVIKMLINKITKEKPDEFIIIPVSTWAYAKDEGSHAFLKGFYKDIEKAISKNFTVSGIQQAFQDYVNIISGGKIGYKGWLFSFAVKDKNTTLVEAKKHISEIIQKTGKKLLIVLDDIDRLLIDEILLLLQLVRENSDFKNTIFLLSYDPIEINRQLKLKDINPDYIEKIVQWDMALPDFSYQSLVEYIIFELELKRELLKLPKTELPEDDKLYQLIKEVFNPQYKYNLIQPIIKNLRHAKRLLNSIFFFYPTLPGEVNLGEYIKLEVLRQHYTHAYQDIVNNPAIYLGGAAYNIVEHITFSDNKEARKKYIQGHVEKLLAEDQHLKRLLCDLFPVVDSAFSGVSFSRTEKRPCCISDIKYFPRYFSGVVPEDQIPDTEILECLQKWEREDKTAAAISIHEYLTQKQNAGKLSKFFQELLATFDQQITSKVALLLIEEIYCHETQYNNEFTMYSDWDFIEYYLARLIYFLDPDTLKSEAPKIIAHLGIYRAFNLAENMMRAGNEMAENYYYKHRSSISTNDFQSLKKPLFVRFQDDIINKDIKFFDYFGKRSGRMWFIVQRGNTTLDLESYMIKQLNDPSALKRFIGFYIAYENSFDGSSLKTFHYPKLLEFIEENIDNSKLNEDDKNRVRIFCKHAKQQQSVEASDTEENEDNDENGI